MLETGADAICCTEISMTAAASNAAAIICSFDFWVFKKKCKYLDMLYSSSIAIRKGIIPGCGFVLIFKQAHPSFRNFFSNIQVVAGIYRAFSAKVYRMK
jgi:hypothetical protein